MRCGAGAGAGAGAVRCGAVRAQGCGAGAGVRCGRRGARGGAAGRVSLRRVAGAGGVRAVSACLLALLLAADVFAGFFAQVFFGCFFRGFFFRAEQDSPEEVQGEELEKDDRDGVAVAGPNVDDVDGGDGERGDDHDDDARFFAELAGFVVQGGSPSVMVGGISPVVFFLHLKRIGRRLPVLRSCMGVMQGGVDGSGVFFWHAAFFLGADLT